EAVTKVLPPGYLTCHESYREKLHLDQLRTTMAASRVNGRKASMPESPLAVARAGGCPGPGKLPSGNPGGTCMANKPVNAGSRGPAVPPPPVHHDATPAPPAAAQGAPALPAPAAQAAQAAPATQAAQAAPAAPATPPVPSRSPAGHRAPRDRAF